MPSKSHSKDQERTQLKKEKALNIIIAGVGGQGNVTASRIVGNAVMKGGYKVTIGETFGAGQRGGAVTSHVRITKEMTPPPLIPPNSASVVIGLEPMETLRAVLDYLKPDALTITNSRPIIPVEVNLGQAKYPLVDEMFNVIRKMSSNVVTFDAYELADQAGATISANIVMIGALAATKIVPCTDDHFKKVITERWPRAKEVNLKAFQTGKEETLKQLRAENPRTTKKART